MHEFFENSSPELIAQSSDNAVAIQKTVIQFAKTKSPAEQRTFATIALRLMSELFEFEHQMNLDKKEQGQQLGLSLYRTFDMLDEIFNLDYVAEKEMSVSLDEKERLYEGAGVGVQTSYSTVLVALRYLNPAKGSRFIDLGSGYGRVGLVVGLMRPDIDFVGYEFVNHRVGIAEAATVNLGLDQHVKFITQDLSSLSEFKIPIADTYYIYDSFSESTYNHVLSQLVEIAQKRKITIVTKGNARQWMENSTFKSKWAPAQQLDDGNLCIFRAR
jgi:precorrin-6B methylase 2